MANRLIFTIVTDKFESNITFAIKLYIRFPISIAMKKSEQ